MKILKTSKFDEMSKTKVQKKRTRELTKLNPNDKFYKNENFENLMRTVCRSIMTKFDGYIVPW